MSVEVNDLVWIVMWNSEPFKAFDNVEAALKWVEHMNETHLIGRAWLRHLTLQTSFPKGEAA